MAPLCVTARTGGFVVGAMDMVGTLVVAAAKLLAYYWRAALAAAQPRAGLACCVLPASPPHILIYGNFIYFPLLARSRPVSQGFPRPFSTASRHED